MCLQFNPRLVRHTVVLAVVFHTVVHPRCLAHVPNNLHREYVIFVEPIWVARTDLDKGYGKRMRIHRQLGGMLPKTLNRAEPVFAIKNARGRRSLINEAVV